MTATPTSLKPATLSTISKDDIVTEVDDFAIVARTTPRKAMQGMRAARREGKGAAAAMNKQGTTQEEELSSVTDHTDDDTDYSLSESVESDELSRLVKKPQTEEGMPPRSSEAAGNGDSSSGDGINSGQASADEWEEEDETTMGSKQTLQMPSMHNSREEPKSRGGVASTAAAAAAKIKKERDSAPDSVILMPQHKTTSSHGLMSLGFILWGLSFLTLLLCQFYPQVFQPAPLTSSSAPPDDQFMRTNLMLPPAFGNLSEAIDYSTLRQLSDCSVLIALPAYVRLWHPGSVQSLEAQVLRKPSGDRIKSQLVPTFDDLMVLEWTCAQTGGPLQIDIWYRRPGPDAVVMLQSFDVHTFPPASPTHATGAEASEGMSTVLHRQLEQTLHQADKLLQDLASRTERAGQSMEQLLQDLKDRAEPLKNTLLQDTHALQDRTQQGLQRVLAGTAEAQRVAAEALAKVQQTSVQVAEETLSKAQRGTQEVERVVKAWTSKTLDMGKTAYSKLMRKDGPEEGKADVSAEERVEEAMASWWGFSEMMAFMGP